MFDLGVLRELGTAVLGAAGVLAVARAVRLPPLLGYLVAGLLLGPVTGILAVGESLDLLAHLGVALLLFLVGLELSVDRIREVGRTAALVGAAQMAVTFLLGAGLALGLGFPTGEALFLGLAVTFSSTVVVVKLLDEAGEIATRHGRLSVGVLLVQDVGVALALTVVAGMSGGGGEAASLGRQLGVSLLGLVALVAAAAAAVRWGLGRVLDWLWEIPEGAFIASLTWSLLLMIGAKAAGLSVELGAFVAGVAVAQLPRAHDLHRRVRPLVDFLLALFFVALGAGLDLGAAARYGGAVLALSALVLVGKPLLVGGLLGAAGESDRTGLRAGLTLGQISEFAFVLTASAVAAGLVSRDLFSVVGAVGLITIGVSAVTAPLGDRLHGLLRRRGRGVLRLFGGDGSEVEAPEAMRGHVVVVGMNALGREVVRSLADRGEPVLAVDTDPDKLRDLPAETLVGDVNLGVVLEEIGLHRARLVISALHIEDTNRLLVHRCRAAGVPVSVNVFDPATADVMRELGADHLIHSKQEGARRLAERLIPAGEAVKP